MFCLYFKEKKLEEFEGGGGGGKKVDWGYHGGWGRWPQLNS